MKIKLWSVTYNFPVYVPGTDGTEVDHIKTESISIIADTKDRAIWNAAQQMVDNELAVFVKVEKG